MERYAEEKRRWRRRTEREVAAERKLRQQAERVNKKLGRELVEMRRVTEELQRERSAKEILEQVCDELVRGVGKDKAEAERLRKEIERAKSEMEKEREMMHITDVLREEKVQMKLTEAKFEFDEKNAPVERLRSELWRVLTAEEEEEKGYSPLPWRVLRTRDLSVRRSNSNRRSSDREEQRRGFALSGKSGFAFSGKI